MAKVLRRDRIAEDTEHEGEGHVKTHIETRNYAATSQGTPGTTKSCNRQDDSSLEPPNGAKPYQHLHFKLLPSRTMEE